MSHWTKRPTITRKVIDNATLGKDVAAIVRETGVKPNTVRVVLRRAYVSGEIHLKRFRKGASSRAIAIAEPQEVKVVDVTELNNLLIEWSKNGS